MYMVGLSHTTRMLFSTLTVMISVPAATKLMHWCVTIVNSFFVLEVPLVFTLTFTLFFVYSIIKGMRLKTILEVGFGCGYSTTNFLKAVEEDGCVISIDIENFNKIQQNHICIIKDVDNVQKFQLFLSNCGGFQIC